MRLISGITPTMRSTTGSNCKRGDVVLIPFPFTDFSTFKQRPALIISSDEFNTRSQDVIAAAISSHIVPNPIFGDFSLSQSDLHSGGLPKASIVKLGKVVTIDRRLIRGKLGSLTATTIKEIISKLRSVI